MTRLQLLAAWITYPNVYKGTDFTNHLIMIKPQVVLYLYTMPGCLTLDSEWIFPLYLLLCLMCMSINTNPVKDNQQSILSIKLLSHPCLVQMRYVKITFIQYNKLTTTHNTKFTCIFFIKWTQPIPFIMITTMVFIGITKQCHLMTK